MNKVVGAPETGSANMKPELLSKFYVRGAGALPLCVLLWLSGCITHPDAKQRLAYVCPDGYQFTVVYSGSRGSVRFEDAQRKLNLDRVEAASGERYTDGNFVFWSRGLEALIQENDKTLHKDCTGDNI
jgi:membrane-bound inhibitor of C-type lysozyme